MRLRRFPRPEQGTRRARAAQSHGRKRKSSSRHRPNGSWQPQAVIPETCHTIAAILPSPLGGWADRGKVRYIFVARQDGLLPAFAGVGRSCKAAFLYVAACDGLRRKKRMSARASDL